MRVRRFGRMALLGLMTLVVALSGCNRFEARQLIRKGNDFFKAQQYEDALKLYREAQNLDPSEVRLHKFIGYAAMALYQPGSTHEKDLQVAKLAIDSFQRYLATNPKDQDKISQFLVTMYMNSNQIYEAIGFFKTWFNSHPEDEQAVNSIAMLYAKQGDYESTVNWQQKRIDMLQQMVNSAKPNQTEEFKRRLAEAYYTLGVTCWQKSYDSSETVLDLPSRVKVLDKGMDALKKALEARPGYSDSMAYTNLILRQYAKFEPDEVKKAAYTAQADEWLKKAVAAREEEKKAERIKAADQNPLEAM